MRFKVVVRILDRDGALLGWTPLQVEARGDGMLRAVGPCTIPIERVGIAEVVSYHWTELNVQRRVPFPGGPATVSGHVAIDHPDNIVLILPSDEGPLPAVTVRSGVSVNVPVGAVGATQ